MCKLGRSLVLNVSGRRILSFTKKNEIQAGLMSLLNLAICIPLIVVLLLHRCLKRIPETARQ